MSAKDKKKRETFQRNRKGSIVLGDGTTITKKEYNTFRNNVYKANKKREQMIDNYYEKTKNKGILKGMSKEVYTKELENRGLITRKQSYSLTKVKNKQDKQRKLSGVNKIANTKYVDNKFKEIKRKMYDQIDSRVSINTSRKLKNRLGRLTKEEFVALYLQDTEFTKEIFYWSGEDEEEFAEYTKTRIELALEKILEE